MSWPGASSRGAVACLASTGLLVLFASAGTITAWLGFVALVPWLWALERSRTWRGHVLLAAAMSVGMIAGPFGWFPGALAGFSGAPLWACWLAVLSLTPVLEPQLFAYALVHRALSEGSRARAHVTAVLTYVGVEWAWPKLLQDTLAYPLHTLTRLRQSADLFGVRGLTVVVLLVNVTIVLALEEALRGRSRPVPRTEPRAHARAALRGALFAARPGSRRALVPITAAAALLLVLGAYGELRLQQLHRAPVLDTLRVGLVQASFTAYEKRAAEVGTLGAAEEVLSTHFQLSDALVEHAHPDLVVWPETVYPTTFGAPKSDEGAQLDKAVGGWVASRKVPLLFGAYDRDGDTEYNAAMLLRPTGGRRVELDSYRKTLLFPMTERVPAFLDAEWLREALPWTGRWSAGTGPGSLTVTTPRGTFMLAPLICYETMSTAHAAASVARGASLIVALSNDAWFAGTAAPHLHLMAAAFRSIETRRPQVRSTTTGLSAFIDATGEVQAVTPERERTVLWHDLAPSAHERTLVVTLGDWVGPTALAAAVALLAWALARRPRRAAAPLTVTAQVRATPES